MVDATGQLKVSATAGAQLTSEISNVTMATPEGLAGAKGGSFGVVLSSNKVNSAASAYIDFTDAIDAAATASRAQVGNGVLVSATDNASVTATVSLASTSDVDADAFSGASVGVSAGISLNDVRGGAGFRTGMKWRFCKQAEANQRYVVCNADEGEPGTFKDRILLNSFADGVFEGMTLCAGIVGASKGYLYLRGEYRYLRESLEKVLQQRRQAGLLGDNITGRTDFNFDIVIHLGAGA